MQIIIILILVSLLTDCTCSVKTSSKKNEQARDESYIPAMGDRVKVRDPFYRKCGVYIIEKRPDSNYLLKVACPFKNDEIVVSREEILEEDPY